MNFLISPTSESLKKEYYNFKEREIRANGLPDNALKKMGYSKEDIEKLKNDLKEGL